MPPPSEDDHIAGAKKEGALVLYLSTNLADANGLVQLYKSKYPFVKVDMFRADNEKLLNRILTESAANKFNGDAIMISSFEVRVLLQKKLLQRYVSPHAKYYPEGFTDKEGYWTSVYSIPRVIAYNTNLAKPDVAPKSWEDILHPRWKGGFGLSDSATLWYTGFMKYLGEEKGRDFMRKLATQKPAFRDGESIVMQLLAAGEFPLGMVYSHQVATLKRRGAPVDWVRTAQPIVTGLKPLGLAAKTQHPNAAKLFIDLAPLEGRPGADQELQPHPRPRRRNLRVKRRPQTLPRRPALGRQLCEICGGVSRDIFQVKRSSRRRTANF